MDKLEEHIRKNREELDRYKPSARMWNRIRKEVKKGKAPVALWLSIAAMTIVVIGTAILFYTRQNIRQGYVDIISGDDNLINTGPRLKETEIYYNNIVTTLYREASPLLTANPDVKQELNADMFQLDSICADIKKDLKDNVANQEVVEALIQNYRIKIRLLEDMLVILKSNEDNAEKNNDHEL
jgi:hypothetical protein